MIKYNNTKSFELVSLMERLPMFDSFDSIKTEIKILLKFNKFKFLTKRKINNKKISNKEIIDLYINLFKEYFYLNLQLDAIRDLNSESVFNYIMIDNSIIDSSITY